MEQESNEQEPNEATEIVGGKVETVEVSRHPEASIPETDLSLADIERRRSHPLRWALIILAVLCAIIAPYWFGRSLAVNNTDSIVAVLGGVSPQGIALVGWVAVVITYVGLAMAVVVSPSWPWLIVFVLGLACEQFIAGLSMLNLNFWYSTYVVYGKQAGLANAANLGIMGAAIGIAALAVPWTSIPAGWVAVLPLVDIVAIALMRQADPIGGSGCSGCSRRCGSPRSGVPGSSRAASSSRRCTGR